MYHANMAMVEQIQVDSSALLDTRYNFESEHFHWHHSKSQRGTEIHLIVLFLKCKIMILIFMISIYFLTYHWNSSVQDHKGQMEMIHHQHNSTQLDK